MNRVGESLRRSCAAIIGAVFFIAGMLKLMDPVGAGLVVGEYLDFLHLGWLSGLSKPLGTAMALVETITGAALVSGVWRRLFAIVTFVLLAGFTILTAVLWILNPEMDCGCFGEAVHLTHSQSFWKNVVLLAMASAAFIPLNNGFMERKGKRAAFWIVTTVMAAFCIMSQLDIPLVDFMAYAPGFEILDGASGTYEEGESSAEDGTSVLAVSDAYGMSADGLLTEGDVLIVSAYDPAKMDDTDWEKAEKTLQGAAAAGMYPLLVTSSDDGVPVTLGEFMHLADRKTILTLNRSQGGATWISDGTVTAKWGQKWVPDTESLCSLADEGAASCMTARTSHRRITFEALTAGCLALLLLL